MYKITIKRTIKDGGLTFTSPGKTVTEKCYWNLVKKIPAGTYSNCSATTMARKKNSKGKPREAVFLPNVTGFSEYSYIWGSLPMESGQINTL